MTNGKHISFDSFDLRDGYHEFMKLTRRLIYDE